MPLIRIENYPNVEGYPNVRGLAEAPEEIAQQAHECFEEYKKNYGRGGTE